MKRDNIQEMIEERVASVDNFNNLPFDEFVDEIMSLDPRVFDVKKEWVYYSTWRVYLFVNEYVLGEELAEALRGVSIITHDEDKEFTVSDLGEEITDAVEEFIYQKWQNQ